MLRIGCEIQLTPKNAGFKLNCAIAAIAKALQDGSQVRQTENVHCGVGRELLL